MTNSRSRGRPRQASPPRKRAPDDVRERVLEAARICFRRNGAMGTRMDEVADEAGLQRPNLYRYFANREALISAVIVREIEVTNAERRRRIKLRGPVGPILVESLVQGRDIASSDEMTQLILVADMRDTTSAIATGEEKIMNAESDYWLPVLAYGRSRNEINATLSDQRIVRWFLTMQVFLSTREDALTGLASDPRTFFGDFVVPPVLGLARVRRPVSVD